jgi:hypothetical protein
VVRGAIWGHGAGRDVDRMDAARGACRRAWLWAVGDAMARIPLRAPALGRAAATSSAASKAAPIRCAFCPSAALARSAVARRILARLRRWPGWQELVQIDTMEAAAVKGAREKFSHPRVQLSRRNAAMLSCRYIIVASAPCWAGFKATEAIPDRFLITWLSQTNNLHPLARPLHSPR